MVITGGKKYDHQAFLGTFKDFKDLNYQEFIQPKANEAIEKGLADSFDVLLFYDLHDSITPAQKDAYLRLLEKGKPMLFLHHSLVSYQNWPEFKKIVGGKYNRKDSILGPSRYKHDIEIEAKIVDKQHPITKDMDNFTILDETYDNCPINDNVQPLLTTTTKNNIPYLAWINRYKNSKIVYIQLGDRKSTYANPIFRKLISQAIQYLSKKD